SGLGNRYEVLTGHAYAKEQSSDIKEGLAFFNIFLLVFAGIALFVGAFIIYNRFSITIAQRTRELGLLRALGASGGQVVGSVTLVATTLGPLSPALGLGIGVAIVRPLEALLGAFGIDFPRGALQVQPRTVIVSMLVGTAITVISSIAPARRAATIPPIAALRD